MKDDVFITKKITNQDLFEMLESQGITQKEIKEEQEGTNQHLKKLNSKVATNVSELAEHKLWQARYAGALTVVVLLVVPLSIWILFNLFTIHDRIREEINLSLDDKLSQYEEIIVE